MVLPGTQIIRSPALAIAPDVSRNNGNAHTCGPLYTVLFYGNKDSKQTWARCRCGSCPFHCGNLKVRLKPRLFAPACNVADIRSRLQERRGPLRRLPFSPGAPIILLPILRSFVTRYFLSLNRGSSDGCTGFMAGVIACRRWLIIGRRRKEGTSSSSSVLMPLSSWVSSSS